MRAPAQEWQSQDRIRFMNLGDSYGTKRSHCEKRDDMKKRPQKKEKQTERENLTTTNSLWIAGIEGDKRNREGAMKEVREMKRLEKG